MTKFLYSVAESLLEKFGTDMSHVVVVFPGRRAGLFLDQALVQCSAAPVWAPCYTTISDLFRSLSKDSAVADHIEAICLLHKVYAEHVNNPLEIDRFFNWGEVLLSDFDDVDKHLVDAHSLFRNIADIKALDDTSFLTPEQADALKSFFRDFSVVGNTEVKQRFLRLWNKMGDIYKAYKERLRMHGILYEGALQREVVEHLGNGTELPANITYVFVGFNVLNGVEKALFHELKRRGQALFYWDYDTYYTRAVQGDRLDGVTAEAGYFMRQNLKDFAGELPATCFSHFLNDKDIHYVAASNEVSQAKMLPQWLHQHLTPTPSDTAVVLCNEQLLQPVLHSIPADIGPMNVTMGYALRDTTVYGLVRVLMDLQVEGYAKRANTFYPRQLRAAQSHPLMGLVAETEWKRPAGHGADLLRYLLGILGQLGRHFAALQDQTDILTSEAIFHAYKTITRILDLMTGPAHLLDCNDHTLRHIVSQTLQGQSIPFHGEPAVGLQVMGVLETRALDFDHLILLSTNEGYLPRSASATSLIPYNLREAYGLTTMRHKMAVYAYYFYRLIGRASHITFVYNTSNAGSRQNEMSRFLRQLQAETSFTIHYHQLTASCQVGRQGVCPIVKTHEVMTTLVERFDAQSVPVEGLAKVVLSPTALNTYTSCPLKFYYRYVAHIQVQEEVEEGVDNILFGNIFHKTMELAYDHLTQHGRQVRAQDIDDLLEDTAKMNDLVCRAFSTEYFDGAREEYTGQLLLVREVIATYLRHVLTQDRKHCPFTYEGSELPTFFEFDTTVNLADGTTRVIRLNVGGRIDRMDTVCIDGRDTLRIIDYKTGSQKNSFKDFECLQHDTDPKSQYCFQSMLYAYSEHLKRGDVPIKPCLCFVRLASAENFDVDILQGKQPVENISDVADELWTTLQHIVGEIFDPATPFTPCAKNDTCQHCPYAMLCGKQTVDR